MKTNVKLITQIGYDLRSIFQSIWPKKSQSQLLLVNVLCFWSLKYHPITSHYHDQGLTKSEHCYLQYLKSYQTGIFHPYGSKYLLRKCLGYNLLRFGGLSTFSDSVWIHRACFVSQYLVDFLPSLACGSLSPPTRVSGQSNFWMRSNSCWLHRDSWPQRFYVWWAQGCSKHCSHKGGKLGKKMRQHDEKDPLARLSFVCNWIGATLSFMAKIGKASI